MKKLIILGLLGAFFTACSVVKYVPVEGRTEVVYRDTTIFRVDTLKVDVPVEVIKEVVPDMDTLKLETSVAVARAWANQSTRTLQGSIENKHTSLQKPVETKERIVYRDSIVTKQVPYPVEVIKEVKHVPWVYQLFTAIGFLAVGLLLGRLIGRFILKGM